jgi:hypothetical protein
MERVSCSFGGRGKLVLSFQFEAPEFARIPDINSKGGFSAAASYAWHRRLTEKLSVDYDPRVLAAFSGARHRPRRTTSIC